MTGLDAQIEWISRLVAFDTSSGRSNLPLIDDVEDWLTSQGVHCRRVPSPDGTKANLYAVVGPERPGGILLSGHSDVVPVTGQPWNVDPWTATLKDGRLYGRGTCDMKGFCGTALSLVPEFLSAPLARPLILAFSYDEEIGCVGAPAMIDEIAASVFRPALVIVGEPTMMRVVSGHKGSAQFRTTVTGIPAHSSETEQGISAVEVAARLIAGIAEIRACNKRRAPAGSPFSPPYSSLISNLIQGGVQQNILAGECTFRWEMRLLPGEDIATFREPFDAFVRDIEAEMRLVGPEAAVETVQVTSVPPLAPLENDEAIKLARALTGANELNVVSYASEAGQFQQAGFPTAICGPGSIDEAHKANEFVALDQVERCVTFIRKLIPRLA